MTMTERTMQATRRSLVTTGVTLLACAAASVSAPAEGLTDTSVSRSVEALRKAMIAADKASLDTLLANDLSFGHSNGLVQTKGEFMAAVLGRKEVFKSITLSDHSAHVVGASAIVRQTFSSDLELEGKPLSVKLGELQIWMKQGSHWRLVARQAFKA